MVYESFYISIIFVIISHYHSGISYEQAFELTPFEKQLVADFIKEDQDRQLKMRAAMFGIG